MGKRLESAGLAPRLDRVLIYAFLGLVATVCLLPFYSMLVSSTHDNVDISTRLLLLPGDQFAENYTRLVARVPIWRGFLNSVFVTATSVTLLLYFSSMVAFGFSKYRFRGSQVLFLVVLGTLMIPGQLGIIGFFKLMGTFHMLNTYWPLIIPSIANAFGVFFMKQMCDANLRTAIQSRQDPPDVFDLERGYLGDYLDAPFVEDLSALGADKLVKDYVPYTAALATDKNGVIRGVTDNSSPGGFWVRHDVAEEYLGTGDPEEIGGMVGSWPEIIALGEKVAEESEGKVHLLPHYDDVQVVEQYHQEPWVVDGALNIDPGWDEVLDTVREVRARNVDAKLEPFSPGWGNALNEGDVLMAALPSWAGFLIDQEKTAGKWRLVRPPKGFYQGGTYRAIYTESQNKELAYEFVEFIAGPEWQDYNLDETLNMPARQSVFRENMDTFKPELFGGQPVLDVYYDTAMDVPERVADKYGEDILVLFREARDEMIDKGLSNQETYEELIPSTPV